MIPIFSKNTNQKTEYSILTDNIISVIEENLNKKNHSINHLDLYRIQLNIIIFSANFRQKIKQKTLKVLTLRVLNF